MGFIDCIALLPQCSYGFCLTMHVTQLMVCSVLFVPTTKTWVIVVTYLCFHSEGRFIKCTVGVATVLEKEQNFQGEKICGNLDK